MSVDLCQTRVAYRYHQEPRQHVFETEAPLGRGDAVRQLIERHFADSENNLVLPEPGASEAELERHAEVLGLTEILVESPA